MKKIYSLIASAIVAVGFTACTQSDLLEGSTSDASLTSADNAIQFDTYMGKIGTTRADDYSAGPITNGEPTDDNSLKNAKFGVFAYYTHNAVDANANYDPTNTSTTPSNIAPNFMYNQQIRWSTSDPTNMWVYSPVKYWPNGVDKKNGGSGDPSDNATQEEIQKLSFFAVAPFTETPSTAYDASTDGDRPAQITSDVSVKKNDVTKGINAMTTNAFTGNVWVKYLMPNANEAEAVDLLWGVRGQKVYSETDGTDNGASTDLLGNTYNLNLTKQIVGEKVKFLFKHALAKIGGNTEETETYEEPASNTCGFQIKLDVDGNSGDDQNTFLGTNFTKDKTLVTVEKVEIMDGASAATAGIATSGTTSNLANSGWFNIEQGKWENVEVATTGSTYSITADKDNTLVTDETYSLNPNIKEGTINVKSSTIASDNWSATSTDNAYTGGATGVVVDAQPLFAKENVPGLMVIPGGSQTLWVRIKYYVRTLDANLSKKYTEVAQTITNTVDLSSLQSNKYYKIIIHLGLTSVKFEAVVADWETTSDGTYAEDGTYTPGSTPNEAKVWLPSNVVPAP